MPRYWTLLATNSKKTFIPSPATTQRVGGEVFLPQLAGLGGLGLCCRTTRGLRRAWALLPYYSRA
eukprot:1183032-Prorocentrum_minimum.AAC.2